MESNALFWEPAGDYKGQTLRALINRTGYIFIKKILQHVGTNLVSFETVHGEVIKSKDGKTWYAQIIVLYEKIPYVFTVHYHPNGGPKHNPLHAKCLLNSCDDNCKIPTGGLFYNWLKYRPELSQWNLH